MGNFCFRLNICLRDHFKFSNAGTNDTGLPIFYCTCWNDHILSLNTVKILVRDYSFSFSFLSLPPLFYKPFKKHFHRILVLAPGIISKRAWKYWILHEKLDYAKILRSAKVKFNSKCKEGSVYRQAKIYFPYFHSTNVTHF